MGVYMDQIPDEARPAVDRLVAKITDLERQANKLRATVNDILVHGFEAPPLYEIVDPEQVATAVRSKQISVRPDQFFNKPFSTCVREILEERKVRGMGPAEPKELYELLRQGGYAFDTKSEADATRAMLISIGKNTVTFTRLPSGQIGLTEWYGPAPKKYRVRTPAPGRPPEQTTDRPAGTSDQVSSSGLASVDDATDGDVADLA